MKYIIFLILFIWTSSVRASHFFYSDTLKKKVTLLDPKDYILYDTTNANRVQFDSTQIKRINLSKSNFSEEASIYYKGYCFKVISHFIKDSVISSEPNLFNPICISQKVVFYHNRKLLKVFNYPVKSIVQRVSNNKKMKMLEDVINYFGIIQSKKGVFVIINGYGGCNSCSYFDGIYNVSGSVLAYEYRSSYKIFGKVGDVLGTIKRLGINIKEYNQYSYSMIKIYLYPNRQI